MAVRLYTPEEANKLIPEMTALVKQLQKHQDNVRQLMGQAELPIPPIMYNLGSRMGSDMAAEFIVIEEIIEKIKSHGGQIKDIEDGLIEFPGLINGREEWLCLQIGERAITHFHDFGKGFKDRKEI